MNGSAKTQAADVIIVGGGLMGASAAFFLRQRGRSVILLERGLVGQQASGVNFGNVRRQGRHLIQLPLANRARDIWGRLPELLGEDCEFLPSGHLRVFYSDEFAAKGEQYARDAKAYDLHLELFAGNALRDRFPYLGRDVIMASLGAQDGHANPRLATPAFGRAARRAGAAIEENTEVLAIQKLGEDFQVETRGRGTFRAPNLIVAAGAWSGALAAGFGEPVPLTAKGPQMGVTEPVPYRIGPSLGVSTSVEADTVYLRQVKRGNIVFGGGTRGDADIEAIRAYVDPVNTLNQLPRLQRLVPGVGPLRLIRTWSGIESYLPDDLPVLGASEKVAGLLYAFGFCGAGFQIGPGVGDVLAELVDTGTTVTPIDPFHIRRFAPARAA
ncbi:FAD-binding oxidoreductase [Phenylobacterium sp. LjRoot225]|uniref:NAD(P)/FAD-dependent oxidoreductase n=1 Tax=Phenylobacterium sp. LjRoot225 TaxID=3342285 RepID=UPI003ECF1187